MHLDKVKAKTALLVSGKTQSDLADSLELSRHIADALGVSVESLMEQ